MAKSFLDDRALIPSFHLPGRDGLVFDSSDFKRKRNLVLFFSTYPFRDLLLNIEQACPQLRSQNAEAAFICPVSLSVIEDIHRRHRLSYWILSDEKGEVFSKFIQAKEREEVIALFIMDRFGEVFFQYVVSEPEHLPLMSDIIKSLVFIESQCS
jgi:peroxiredoxin